MKDRVFIDTNVLVYIYSDSEKDKQSAARDIIFNSNLEIVISTQVLGEFTNILYKKYDYSIDTIKRAITDFRNHFEIINIYTSMVEDALEIMKKYKFSYWDSMIVSSALKSKCSLLYSEDMQHKQLIEKTLRILNPFT